MPIKTFLSTTAVGLCILTTQPTFANLPATTPSITLTGVTTTRANEVALEQADGGGWRLPVTINRTLSVPFLLDTGAYSVQIPADIYLVLVRQGTINPQDDRGKTTVVTADGKSHDAPTFLIHELKVGNKTVTDVLATISNWTTIPLLGQSFLDRLGRYTVDNQLHTLILEDETDRQITTASQPTPVQLTPQPAVHSAAFDAGLADHTRIQQWVDHLSGAYRAGVEYWASVRSTGATAEWCNRTGSDADASYFMSGCLAAKRMFDPTDIRRKNEPDYKAGWQSFRTSTVATTSAGASDAFEAGLDDRQSLQRWFDSLPAGEYKNGADYWISHRSKPEAANGCGYPTSPQQVEWAKGCLNAKQLFDPTDAKRLSNPDYRTGWNSFHAS